MPTQNTPPAETLDLLHGADKIAEFIFGDAKMRKRIYNLAESKAIPTFKLGATLCARRSTIKQWIVDQEQMGLA